MPDGGPVRLRNFVGAPFVLYFYPKDDTSGCTREAQEFSARLDAFKEAGAVLLGELQDKTTKPQTSHEKYGLTVTPASHKELQNGVEGKKVVGGVRPRGVPNNNHKK